MKPLIYRRSWPGFGALSIILMIIFIMTGTVEAAVSNEDCTSCHDEISENFAATPHGAYLGNTSAADNSCESCHGPGEAHMENQDPALIINPAGHDQMDGAETCLNCHSSHKFDDWAFSTHNAADVSCAGCHVVHGEKAMVKKSSPELCYDCHSEVRASSYMPSHHPVAEGKIDCLDCHNVHGGTVEFAMGEGVKELCFSCHADKEGPFVFEHAPAAEDCMICHTPHGSVADNLLKQNEPSLCLNCHAMHFHATVEGVVGEFTPPLAPERTGISTRDAWKRGMLTKCTQCHTAIHGTDHPSQAMSTGGNGLTR